MNTRGAQRIAAALNQATVRARAETLLQDPRVRAMLDSIGFSEGTDKRFGYQTHVGGGVSQAEAGQKDRRVVYVGRDRRGRPLYSSADGRYQFINSTWDSTARALGLTDFSPHSQDLAAVYQLMTSGATGALARGDFGGAVSAARSIWASFPGAGYGQGERSLASLQAVYNRSLAGGGITPANPLPVALVGGDASLSSGLQWHRFHALAPPAAQPVAPTPTPPQAGGSFNPATAPVVVAAAQQRYTQTLKDTVPVVVNVTDTHDQLLQTTARANQAEGLYLAQAREVPGVLDAATKATYAYSLSQEQYRQAAITAASTFSRISGALAQSAGFLPQQQVGHKRGFFSKLLGFAAPLLSFVPGAGPSLSTLAGIGSSAAGGDWGSALTQGVAGFKSGGAFRGHGDGSSGGLPTGTRTTNWNNLAPVTTPLPGRAVGGPVSRGRAYIVGERRPEVFVPEQDGWIHPSAAAYGRGAGGGGHWWVMLERIDKSMERQAAAAERHAAALERIETAPPE